MSVDFIILPFTADSAKEFAPEKNSKERFRICIVTSQKSLWQFQWILSTNKNLHLRVDAFHVIGYIVTIVLSKWNISQEQSPMKTEEKTLTMQCPFLKRGSVAAYQRSLRIRAVQGKNIPRPSMELMNCI